MNPRYFYCATGGDWSPTDSFDEAKKQADERGTEVIQYNRKTGGMWTVYFSRKQPT